MKKLIVVAHPNLNESVINKRWIEELQKYPDQFTIHNLYTTYPDHKINVEKEQKLVDDHESIILQYPLYWFNTPSLLKKWFDDVYLYGWAYGSKGNALKDKKIALAISAGIKEIDYTKNGKMSVTMEEILVPMGVTIRYCKADYQGSFVLYDTHNAVRDNILEDNCIEYIKFLNNL